MSRLDTLHAAAERHKGLLDGTKADIERLRRSIAEKENELILLQQHHKDMDWSYRYLDALVKAESGRFIGRLQEILDYGVKTIFDDRDYRVRIVVEDNKRASIHLVYKDEEGNEISPDIRDCGGGVRTVIGILAQVFSLFNYNVEKLLVIDEGLSQLSSNYLPNLFGLLDELAKENHLKVLLITHDDRMTEYASRQYIVEDHKVKEISGNK